MPDVQMTKLSNGTRIITSTMPHVHSASIGLWAGVGGRYEPEELAGVSHFLEHMMFKGTKKRSSKRISQDIEGSGGYLNAFTQEESTCYYARVAYDKLWNAFDVLSDMYQNSLLKKEELDKERGVILEEIMMYRDQPHHLVMEMLSELLWDDHPLGNPIIGFPETIEDMKRKHMAAFRSETYRPTNTVVSIAGRVNHDKCVERAEKLLGAMKKEPAPNYIGVTTKTGQNRLKLHEKTVEQSHMAVGVRLFGRSDNRKYTLRVLNTILGENMSSRLFQVVREKHGLAYSIHSSCHLHQDSGALVISAGLDRHRHTKGMELIVKEIHRMKEKPVTASELKRAKDYVVGQLRLSVESTSNQMISMGDNIISHGRFIPREEIIKNVESVTADDVQRLARTIFRKTRTSLALIVPELDRGDERFYRKQLDTI
ncbi:hypothetical protein BVX97_02835 [bacterium E08(2017)]|nr:hypothetical protein BVX97_02835 [bacterium E08(2017)]